MGFDGFNNSFLKKTSREVSKTLNQFSHGEISMLTCYNDHPPPPPANELLDFLRSKPYIP